MILKVTKKDQGSPPKIHFQGKIKTVSTVKQAVRQKHYQFKRWLEASLPSGE